MEKIYKQRNYGEAAISVISSIILFILTIVFFVVDEIGLGVGCLIGFFSAIYYAIYYIYLDITVIIGDSVVTKSKFITSKEVTNNFSNCIEYDILKEKSLVGVVFKTTQITISVQIKKGINQYETESYLFEVDDSQVDSLIKDLTAFLDKVKVAM